MDIKDRTPGFYLTKVGESETEVSYVATAGATAALITFGKHHYHDLDWTAEQFAHAWALQPEKLRRTVMPLHLRIHDREGSPPLYNYFRIQDNRGGGIPSTHNIDYPPEQWQFDDRAHWHFRDLKVNLGFEELMTHELCHGVDREGEIRFGEPLSRSEAWSAAIESDGQYITDYARRNGVVEEFAESCAIYILLKFGHRGPDRINDAHDARVAGAMPARYEYLERLFGGWSDTIQFDAVRPTKTNGAPDAIPTVVEHGGLADWHTR